MFHRANWRKRKYNHHEAIALSLISSLWKYNHPEAIALSLISRQVKPDRSNQSKSPWNNSFEFDFQTGQTNLQNLCSYVSHWCLWPLTNTLIFSSVQFILHADGIKGGAKNVSHVKTCSSQWSLFITMIIRKQYTRQTCKRYLVTVQKKKRN